MLALGCNAPTVDDIIAYEDGSMHEEDVVVFFQKLIDSKMLWSLQGSYIRTAERLIREGLCVPK